MSADTGISRVDGSGPTEGPDARRRLADRRAPAVGLPRLLWIPAACAFALVALPYVALPFYWAFGRSRYLGYLHGRGAGDLDIHRLAASVRQALHPPRNARRAGTPSPAHTLGRHSANVTARRC